MQRGRACLSRSLSGVTACSVSRRLAVSSPSMAVGLRHEGYLSGGHTATPRAPLTDRPPLPKLGDVPVFSELMTSTKSGPSLCFLVAVPGRSYRYCRYAGIGVRHELVSESFGRVQPRTERLRPRHSRHTEGVSTLPANFPPWTLREVTAFPTLAQVPIPTNLTPDALDFTRPTASRRLFEPACSLSLRLGIEFECNWESQVRETCRTVWSCPPTHYRHLLAGRFSPQCVHTCAAV